jgi:hypothetical protein
VTYSHIIPLTYTRSRKIKILLEMFGHLANGFSNTTGVNIITIIAGVTPGANGQGEAMNVHW